MSDRWQVPEGITAETGTADSPDGTSLGYLKLGHGPSLVVCHGSFADAQDWVPFAVELADTHTVYLYDRRGRGASPDFARPSAVDAEVDDLAAIVALAGTESAVLGHSFGGGCALEYASRGASTGPVVLYEPRHSVDAPVSRGHIPEIERLLAESDRATSVRMILEKVIGLPADDIAGFTESPLWPRMMQTVDAFPDELRLLDNLRWGVGDLDGIVGPAWLIVGETSPVLPADREGALRGVLPQLRRVTLPGQGHFAYLSAPAVLAETVAECLACSATPVPGLSQ